MTRRHLAVAAFLWVASAAPLPSVIGGPYVINAGPTSATVKWLTSDGLQSHNLTGLKPGQTVSYDPAGDGSTKGSFKTPPAGLEPFDFVVYGDTRTRHDMHRRVVEAIVKHGAPDFVVHTGDLVANGADASQWPVFFEIEKNLLRETVFFPCLGNHEHNNRQYYDYFDVTTPYYSFDWGTSHFVILNSDIGNAAPTDSGKVAFWAAQRRWLEQDLEKSQKADFRFVVAHHPPITAVGRRVGDNQNMIDLIPLFEKLKVTVVFGGHDHNYQHHVKNGVHYVVTGGGGAPLYPVDSPTAGITRKVESTEHFVTVHVDGAKARIQALALDGRVIERIDLP